MSALSSTSLAVTLAHAVTFLTRPLALARQYPASTLAQLQSALEASLAAAYLATWCPAEPFRGSGRRCLSLAADCAPPRPVYAACAVAGVEWAVWAQALLAGAATREMDVFVDPGCVSVRVAGAPGLVTVWSDELERQQQAEAEMLRLQAEQRQLEVRQTALRLQLQLQQLQLKTPQPISLAKVNANAKQPKTLAQRLMEADAEEDDALFSMLADEMRAPTWLTPIIEQFPSVPPQIVIPDPSELTATAASFSTAARAALGHSRSSSRASTVSSSAFSFLSDESATSCGTLSSVSSSSSLASAADAYSQSASGMARQSRRERARQARVFVDASKKEVTPYDGGKTTVLTGGVMLGGGPVKPAPMPTSAASAAAARRARGRF